MRVRPPDEDDPGNSERTVLAHAGAWLELDLMLPGLGAVRLQIQPRQGGVALAMLPRQTRAMPLLREAVPEIAVALARLGVPLQRCELGQPLPRPVYTRSTGRAAVVIQPMLLGAAAEVAAVLAQRWPAVPDAAFSPTSPPP